MAVIDWRKRATTGIRRRIDRFHRWEDRVYAVVHKREESKNRLLSLNGCPSIVNRFRNRKERKQQ